MAKKLTAVSLFSGCGGFDWGAAQAGLQIIWANDCDRYAASAYRALFPDVEFHEEDIREIDEFPEADVLIGCYPCTGFSEAAKRKHPFAKTKRYLRRNPGNHLFREFLRALRIIRPRFLFVENVRGMLTASSGWFLARQLAGFRRNGYRVKLKMLHAEDFGVPQLRRRLFIVGVHSSVKNFGYEFPAPTHGPGTDHAFVTLRDAIEKLVLSEDDVWKKPFHGHYLTRPRKRNWDDPSYTIVAHAGHVPLHPSGSLMRHVGKDRYSLEGLTNRRLSWRECAALQSLPPTMTISGGLAAKYRVVGNAVPPPLARALVAPIVSWSS